MKSTLTAILGAATLVGALYTSPKRLYQTKEGQLVGAEDPAGVTLVVGEGGQLPLAKAIELGLVTNETGAPVVNVLTEPVTDPKVSTKPPEMEIEKKARKAAKVAQPTTTPAANIAQADESKQGEHV